MIPVRLYLRGFPSASRVPLALVLFGCKAEITGGSAHVGSIGPTPTGGDPSGTGAQKQPYGFARRGNRGRPRPRNVSHMRYEGENLSQALFSIARLMGVSLTSLGAKEGLVNGGLTGLGA
jgi:hypothetical protein